MNNIIDQTLNLAHYLNESKKRVNDLMVEKTKNLLLISQDKDICSNKVVLLGDFKSLNSNLPDYKLNDEEKLKMAECLEKQYNLLEKYYNDRITDQESYTMKIKEIYENHKLGIVFNLADELRKFNII